MNKISKKIGLNVSAEKAFHKFVHEFNEWWPKEYTWSQQQLREIKIEAKKDGLCSEIGPYGFRCDWGRVTEFAENQKIGLKWQISPKREPIPNPDNASDIQINFLQYEDSTTLTFEHFNFENHGESAENYCNMMDSEYGWDYILQKYKSFCKQ